MSLDALRGFDMFWIIGGTGLVLSLAHVLGFDEYVPWLRNQFTHPTWNGFTFYDLIFPLFVFLVGVAMPFSFSKHVDTRGKPRTLVLVRLPSHGAADSARRHLQQRRAQAEFCRPSFLQRPRTHRSVLFFRRAHHVAQLGPRTPGVDPRALVGILGGHDVDSGAELRPGNLAPGATLADYIDRTVLPGKLHAVVRDPEGLFSTIPAVATALIGVLAGQWLRESRRNGHVKAAALLVAAGLCLALGYFWDRSFPINKNLWSSSFVLWAAGWSLMLLGLFYLAIDVWGWKSWAFVFVVIGANAITIYVAQQWIDFDALGQLLFAHHAPLHHSLLHNASLLMKWFSLYILYRQRIFLRL